MFRIACGALAGVCCLLVSSRLPTTPELTIGGPVLLTVAWLLRARAVAAFAIAVVIATVDARARLDDWLPQALEGAKVTVTGVVSSVPQAMRGGTRFEFDPDHGDEGWPQRLQLTWYDAPRPPRAAERWSLDVKLRRPRGFANPGGSDLAARYLRERIGATGYVRSGTRLAAKPGDFRRRLVLRSRAGIAEAIRAAIGERPATGILTGLAVGLQDALSTEQWNALSRSGTSHLMAISGLHIGMIAAAFGWVALRVQHRRQRHGATTAARDAAVVAGAFAAAGYSVLAGASVPTLRTLLMISIGAAALLRRRNAGVADGLGVSLLAVLSVDPLAPLAPGFWLSFVAVGILCATMGGHVLRPRLVDGYLKTQLVVTLGLVPVLAGAFGTISLVSVPVNLVAIPLYTLVVVPAVLVGSAVATCHVAAGRLVLEPVASLVDATWPLIAVPAASSLASWNVSLGSPWTAPLLVLASLAVLAPLAWHARAAATVALVIGCCSRPASPEDGRALVTVLDVGQGLAVVVETHRHVLLYDTGPAFRSGSDAAQFVVLPYLRHRGIRVVDVLAISHDDDDHSGGYETLRDSTPIRRFYTNGTGLPRGEKSRRCDEGVTWTWDGVRFAWLTPAPAQGDGDNDRSCVLSVEAGGSVLLLPGDIEAGGERRLLERFPSLRADALVVPHHGSRTSSSPDFVAATRPRWAIVSAGYLNRWGMPKEDVVQRWQSAGGTVLTTAGSGAVSFELGADGVDAPRGHREQRRRFWQRP